MDKKEIQTKVSNLSEDDGWNCYFEFPHGVVTREEHIDSPGYNLNKWPRLKSILEQRLMFIKINKHTNRTIIGI